MLGLHLVVRLRSDRIDLRRPEVARVLLRALRARFPEVIIHAVMPDHVHLLLPPCDPERARALLANACGRVQYSLGWPAGSWEPVPAPRVITKLSELRRHYRYIALNECRAGLARDPLESAWSSYREMFGAVADPWIDRDAVLRRLGAPRRDPLGWLHAYVSGDPSSSVGGTPLPRAAAPSAIATAPLSDVIRAAAAAHREPADAILRSSSARRTFVGVARRVGWGASKVLAQACGVTDRAIRFLANEADAQSIGAALVCLGDARLLLRTPAISRSTTAKRKQKSR